MTTQDLAPSTVGLSVEVVRTEQQWQEGLDLCDSIYNHTYNAHWLARPDVLFIARTIGDGSPVATAGLELARQRHQIDSERYFRLTPRMQAFIDTHRDRIAEFGRFACSPQAAVQGAQAVFQAALTYCLNNNVDYLFAWARPAVSRHGAKRLGVPFWVIDVPLNDEEIRTCGAWTSPPINFFYGHEQPQLLLAVMPFFELVTNRLSTRPDAAIEVDRDDLELHLAKTAG